jgi:hypothetical protein
VTQRKAIVAANGTSQSQVGTPTTGPDWQDMFDLNSIFSLDNTESDEATNDGGSYDREESVSSHTYNIPKQNYRFSKPDRPFGNVRPSFLDHLSTTIYPGLEVRQAAPDPWIEWDTRSFIPEDEGNRGGHKRSDLPKTQDLSHHHQMVASAREDVLRHVLSAADATVYDAILVILAPKLSNAS